MLEINLMKKIWHFSDSHAYHDLLVIPEDVDIVIFSGDCSNPKDPYSNEPEVRDFIDWYKNLPIKYKIFVPGNHDTSIERGLVTSKDFTDAGIIYLENDYIDIDGIKIFGSPYTPTFGTGWAWNKSRNNLDQYWSKISEDVDILITHGPPKSILDASMHRDHFLEFCGCNSLKKHVLGRIKPKLHLFGHIHNSEDAINAGVLKLSAYETTFSNGSVVTDRQFGKLSSHGNILEI
jgi:Icc-related predicted phosphoesterase